MNNKPIGIIDSGVGGLSIWREIVHLMPGESTVYIGDTKRCPYGSRESDEIHELSKRLVRFLLSKNVKAIVIACNTITVTSLDVLRSEFPEVPLLGIVPVVKTARERTKTKRIGVLSTQVTARSLYQRHLLEEFVSDCIVVNKGTDTLVPFIEKGEIEGEVLDTVLKKELEEFNKKNIDTLALGCSHFSFIRNALKKQLGEKVILLDSADAVARHTQQILSKNNAFSNTKPTHIFYTSGDAKTFAHVSQKLLDLDISRFVKRIEV